MSLLDLIANRCSENEGTLYLHSGERGGNQALLAPPHSLVYVRMFTFLKFCAE